MDRPPLTRKVPCAFTVSDVNDYEVALKCAEPQLDRGSLRVFLHCVVLRNALIRDTPSAAEVPVQRPHIAWLRLHAAPH
jgi:hypothetical protein